jgi:hypothetical protein
MINLVLIGNSIAGHVASLLDRACGHLHSRRGERAKVFQSRERRLVRQSCLVLNGGAAVGG